MKISPASLVLIAVAGLALVASGAVAAHAAQAAGVKVCVKKGVVVGASAKGKCPKKSTKKSVALRGPAGQRGPAGKTGKAGATGPAGTATAYGQVIGGVPQLAERSPAVAAVRRAPGFTTGSYCISFTKPISRSQLNSAVVSTTWFSAVAFVSTTHGGFYCAPNELGVFTLSRTTGEAVGTDFTFIVP